LDAEQQRQAGVALQVAAALGCDLTRKGQAGLAAGLGCLRVGFLFGRQGHGLLRLGRLPGSIGGSALGVGLRPLGVRFGPCDKSDLFTGHGGCGAEGVVGGFGGGAPGLHVRAGGLAVRAPGLDDGGPPGVDG
jgi:hypothetical protein